MEKLNRIKGFTLALVFSLVNLLTACVGPSSSEPTISASKPTPVPPTSTPTPIPTFTPTPVPTARPLAETSDEEGIYLNNMFGVSLEYPPKWEILMIDESDTGLLTILNPEYPVIVVLGTELIESEMEFEEYAQSFFDILPESLNLKSVNWATHDPEYTLGDDTPSWWAAGEGIQADTNGEVRYELIAAQRGARIFTLSILGYVHFYKSNEIALENIRQSLRIFSPRPYGVDRQNALFLASGEPRTFDPAKVTTSADSIVGDLFSGLVQLDANLQPIPDLAERWMVSPDGTRYTFYLRKGVTFHNGRPFTAHDVKFSWDRACNPETESDTALTYLGDIVGASEVIRGEATEIGGVHLVDDFTIEVTIDSPKPYFISKLAYPTSWIVDRETVEEIEDNPIGTGPFQLIKHDKDEIIILARYPNYHRGFVPLEYLVYLLYAGYHIRLYEAGDIDMIGIYEDLLDRAKDPSDPLFGTVLTRSPLCTDYVAFDTTQPPFDELSVRKAFAQAIDKERYNEIVNEGKGVIAHGLFPPGLPGYDPDLRPINYDPEEAQYLLHQSSFGSTENLPEIVFTVSGAGQDLYPSDALLVQMWEEVLGITVNVEQLDSRTFYEEVVSGNHGHIVSLGWCADYPDPENFADILFHSDRPQNVGGYTNPDLDTYLEEARIEQDLETRFAIYHRIEQMLIDNVPAIFLEHSRAYYIVVKPYVKGYVSVPIGIAQHMNVSISHEE